MVENNNFYIEKIECIVFIGYSDVFEDLLTINKKLNIPTKIISSTDQSTDLRLDHIVFDTVDSNFYDYIQNNFNIKNTLFISLGSRLIFNSKVISFLNGNLVNFHGSRLPYDSGGGGFSWRIMRQDRIDNQLVHLIDEGIDTGPIIDNELSIFPKNCIIPIDFEKYRLKKFLDFYRNFISKNLTGTRFHLKHQLNYIGRYNPRLSTIDNGYINWDWDPLELYNFINSFDEPYSGSMSLLNRGDFGTIHLKSVHLHGGDSSNHPYMSGLVSRHDKKWIVVSTSGKYSLLIEEVLDSNCKNIIDKIKPGDRFYTPRELLEKSLSKKVIFNSKGKNI